MSRARRQQEVHNMTPHQLAILTTKHSDLTPLQASHAVNDYLKGRTTSASKKVAQAVQKYVRSGDT